MEVGRGREREDESHVRSGQRPVRLVPVGLQRAPLYIEVVVVGVGVAVKV